MRLPTVKDKRYSVEEYLAFSGASEMRYEFEQGEIVAMGLTTDAHNELGSNLAAAIKNSVKGRGCKVYTESVGLEVEAESKYYLPDVMLTCDERDHKDRQLKRYPALVAEVISPSSVKRDRDTKFRAYLKIPSLRYYLLISQDQIRIEVFGKMEEKTWKFTYYESNDDIISLDQLGMELKVGDVYEEVELMPYVPDSGDE